MFGAVQQFQGGAKKIGHLHLRHLNPLPTDLKSIFSRFKKILVCELNAGQLAFILRSRFLLQCELLTKIQGQQFSIAEIETKINTVFESEAGFQ